jgi:hypothetical protein
LPGHRLSWADHEHLLAKLANLATDAAAASRNNDDDQGAITALELGRAVLLAKSLCDETWMTRLHAQDADLATRVREVQNLLSGV